MRCTSARTEERTPFVSDRKPLLNFPKKPPRSRCAPAFTCLSIEAQSAGVKVRATMTESTIEETIVTEN